MVYYKGEERFTTIRAADERGGRRSVDELQEMGGGVTLLDGAALVIGAAVASVHLRPLASLGLTWLGWGMAWLTFAGVALSAAGPFVYLARRYGRRPPGYPRIGDRLWGAIGLPWVLTAPLRPAQAMAASAGATLDFRQTEWYSLSLWLGIGVACLVALTVIWTRWVLAPPDTGLRRPAPWTDRIGLLLAVCWPLQCGFGLVVVPA